LHGARRLDCTNLHWNRPTGARKTGVVFLDEDRLRTAVQLDSNKTRTGKFQFRFGFLVAGTLWGSFLGIAIAEWPHHKLATTGTKIHILDISTFQSYRFSPRR
jgi:hypothetical protein